MFLDQMVIHIPCVFLVKTLNFILTLIYRKIPYRIFLASTKICCNFGVNITQTNLSYLQPLFPSICGLTVLYRLTIKMFFIGSYQKKKIIKNLIKENGKFKPRSRSLVNLKLDSKWIQNDSNGFN